MCIIIRQGPARHVQVFHTRSHFRAPQNGHAIISAKKLFIIIIG